MFTTFILFIPLLCVVVCYYTYSLHCCCCCCQHLLFIIIDYFVFICALCVLLCLKAGGVL